MRGLTRKYLLRRAAKGLVPDQVLEKKKVGFFIGAMGTWFRAQAGGAIEEYLLDRRPVGTRSSSTGRGRGGSFAARRPDRGARRLLVSILMLEVWLRDFLPRATGDGSPARERIRVPA